MWPFEKLNLLSKFAAKFSKSSKISESSRVGNRERGLESQMLERKGNALGEKEDGAPNEQFRNIVWIWNT